MQRQLVLGFGGAMDAVVILLQASQRVVRRRARRFKQRVWPWAGPARSAEDPGLTTLDEVILELLAHPHTADALLQDVLDDYGSCSRSTLYRALRRLWAAGVVTYVGDEDAREWVAWDSLFAHNGYMPANGLAGFGSRGERLVVRG